MYFFDLADGKSWKKESGIGSLQNLNRLTSTSLVEERGCIRRRLTTELSNAHPWQTSRLKLQMEVDFGSGGDF